MCGFLLHDESPGEAIAGERHCCWTAFLLCCAALDLLRDGFSVFHHAIRQGTYMVPAAYSEADLNGEFGTLGC